MLEPMVTFVTAAPPPKADRRPHEIVQHGERRIDPYAWLAAENWQAVAGDPSLLAPDIRAYLEAENAYTEGWFTPLADLTRTLATELKARLKPDEASVPVPDGPWRYGTRYRPGGQHPIWWRSPRDGGPETTLLDGDAAALGHAYFRVGGAAACPRHRHFAYALDTTGAERFRVRVRDIASGTDLDDEIPNASGSFAWSQDGSAILYTELDDAHRPWRVRCHRIGADPLDARVIYTEEDPAFFVSVDHTVSRRYLMISSGTHETTEVRLLDSDLQPRVVRTRETGVEYSVEDWGDCLAILTNRAGAEDFMIATCPLLAGDEAIWVPLVPHQSGVLIVAQSVSADHHVRLERAGGLPRLVVRDRAGSEHMIAFDEAAYSLGLAGVLEYAHATLRFTYSSMATPERVFDYDLGTRTRVLRREQEIPSGHDPALYRVERLMAPAPDGALVPVSVLMRHDHPRDGSRPLLLYAYGAYGYALPAAFSTTRFSLVDRGCAVALAHIRGGTDCGRRWYLDGKRQSKPNSFTDCIAAAETLIATGITSTGRIVAQGGSAGGMVMGAIANLRPDLFAGIVAEVPFVDVLNTMSNLKLPLTPIEFPEWGNPIESAADYALIRGYSPYENIAARPYPAIFALGGLSDPRVTYWEPAKWVAALRATTTGSQPMMLKTNMTAGHGGAAGRYDRLDEVAQVYAFVLASVGLAPSGV